MFGTDSWICLTACSYHRWHEVVRHLAAALSVEEKESLRWDGGPRVRPGVVG